MPSCCVVGCSNRYDKNNKTRKFYRIPSTRTPFKANKRRLWLQAIRRSDWNDQIIKNATICSDHFISGVASDDYDSPNFVPSIFPETTQSGDGKTQRYTRKRRSDETPSMHQLPATLQTFQTSSEHGSTAGGEASSSKNRQHDAVGGMDHKEEREVSNSSQGVYMILTEEDRVYIIEYSNPKEEGGSCQFMITVNPSLLSKTSDCQKESKSSCIVQTSEAKDQMRRCDEDEVSFSASTSQQGGRSHETPHLRERSVYLPSLLSRHGTHDGVQRVQDGAKETLEGAASRCHTSL